MNNSEKFLDICNCSHEEQEQMAIKFNAPIRYESAISQLQGIAYAITFDDVLSNDELKILVVWLMHNAEFVEAWPISSVYSLFMEAIDQGQVTPEINSQLFRLLKNIGSTENVIDAIFDKINDTDVFSNSSFVVTGGFESGFSRKEVGAMIINKGGLIQKNVGINTDYLIVGEKGSKAWRFGKFGRKIEAAIYNRSEYESLKIIVESDFLEFINKD